MQHTPLRWSEFSTYYLNASTYAKKKDLLRDFGKLLYSESPNIASLENFNAYFFKNIWNASLKKSYTVKLQGKGYTAAGIQGIFKKFDEWLKAKTK